MAMYPAQEKFKLILGSVGAIGVLFLFLMTYFTVSQYERCVVTRFGKLSYVADPGLHFKIPFVNSVTCYRTDILSVSPPAAVNIYTVDNQEINITFSVFYNIPPSQVAYIYEHVQDYRERLFQMATDRLKVAMGKVNVQNVAENRGKVRDEIRATLRQDASTLGVEISDFQLLELTYGDAFRNAVAAAANARAGIETKDNERQQAEKEAATRVIKPNAEAASTLAVATAEAKAIELRGEAQAKAIEAQAKALAQNAQLVELRKTERWDGKLPQQLLSGIVPLMQFTPPEHDKK